ncbi:MAG: orotate phosphoribosyltransferase [Proteobacteria bacterium]|nr:orotate phosphoribosyltransferase [Pseudomonadota bacterium]
MSTFSPPVDKRIIAHQTAKMMLEIQAVHFNAESPFVFTSGWASPVYVDCRKIISYPRLRSALMDFSASTILTEIGYESIDNIAGGETAGIPFAAWIADKLSLPMQYIRKKAKGFGRNAQIEGEVVNGARTLLVEDLATDGRSKVNFCNALRKAGARVDHCFVLFYYDIFPMSRGNMKDLGVQLHHLATWWDVLEVAKASGHFDEGVIREVRSFLEAPSQWSAAHGGIAEFGDETTGSAGAGSTGGVSPGANSTDASSAAAAPKPVQSVSFAKSFPEILRTGSDG